MRIGEEVNIKTWILEPYKYATIPLVILDYCNIFVGEDEEIKSPISSEDFIKKVKPFDMIIIRNTVKKKGILFTNKFIIKFKVENIGDRYISGYCSNIKQLIVIDKYKDRVVSIQQPYHIVVTSDSRIVTVFMEETADNHIGYNLIRITEKEFWNNAKSNDIVYMHYSSIKNIDKKYKVFTISEDADNMYNLNILDEYNKELCSIMESIRHHNERTGDDYDE